MIMPPGQDDNFLLQQIFSNLKDLRTDMSAQISDLRREIADASIHYVRKDVYDSEMKGVTSDLQELKDGRQHLLSKLALIIGIISTLLGILNYIHILPK